jgi:hypothetical protein
VLPRSIERMVRRHTQRVRVYFGTRDVTIDLLAGRRKQRSLRRLTHSIEDVGVLDSALVALGAALHALRTEAGDLRGLACEVVLADGWIVYDVISIDLLRVKPRAAHSAIVATLEDVAGAHAGSLLVQWQWQSDGRGVFAMAIPRATIGKLKATFATTGLVLKSVTGEFVAVFNAQRRSLTGRRVVFAVGREAGAQIAVLNNGVIRATRFELGGAGSASLSSAAAGVMRVRGEDTTAPTNYVLDAAAEDALDPHDARWERLRPPAWVSAARRAARH